MNKIFTITILFFFTVFGAMAQDGTKLENLKIAYLTKKLNLTPEEAQRFWPVYNQYADELHKVRSEANQNQEGEIATDEKILNLRKRYNGEFNKVLPPQKVNQLFRSEKEFSGFVQREIMERRQMRMMQQRRQFKP